MWRLALLLCATLAIPAGATPVFELKRGDSRLEVELHEQFDSPAQAELRHWLTELSESLALAYGRWPRERWRIQVLPASRTADDPIPWAQVNRGEIDQVTSGLPWRCMTPFGTPVVPLE